MIHLIPFIFQLVDTKVLFHLLTLKVGMYLSYVGVNKPNDLWIWQKAHFLGSDFSVFEKIQSNSTHLFMDQIQSNLTWALFESRSSKPYLIYFVKSKMT